MINTIFGIGGGLVSAGISILGSHYLDPDRKHAVLWVILALLTWPLLGWGAISFAKFRGHNSVLGVILFLIGGTVYAILAFHARRWYIYSVGTVFVAIMPLVVLLSVPRRPGNLHHEMPRRRSRPSRRV